MVVTPTTRAFDANTPLSPLLLAQRPTESPGIVPNLGSSVGSMSAMPPMPPPLRKSSTGSFSKLSEFWLDGTPEKSSTPTEAPSLLAGIPHIDLSIDASEWRHPVFKQKVLSTLRRLRVPTWTHPALTPSSIHLQKVSGALTNAVFFVSFNPNPTPTSPSMSPMLTPTMPPSDPQRPPQLTKDKYPQTLLLRIYGTSSDQLISRDEELRILHVLSTSYGLGPRLIGTFLNGRVEQFFPSRALVPTELRKPNLSRCIARRMRELHSVELRQLGYESGRTGEPIVWRCISDWIPNAQEILSALSGAGGKWESWTEKYGLHKFRDEIETYRKWVNEQRGKGKGVVFSHNDTQYGNLLLIDDELPKGVPDHHKLIVVDFEYAGPNARGYDIANHFHEWRANYHDDKRSWSLKAHGAYPTIEERQDWYRSYLSVEMSAGEEMIKKRSEISQDRVDGLEREVRIWSPACSALWSLWGIISAEEMVSDICEKTKSNPEAVDFDYLAYALERREMFQEEARALGVPI